MFHGERFHFLKRCNLDKFSILGIFIGFAAVALGQVLEGAMVESLFQLTAFIIVVGGTLGAVMVQSESKVFRQGFKMAKWVFGGYLVDFQSAKREILRWAQLSRRDGLLSLEPFLNRHPDPFVREGLELLINATPPDSLRSVLNSRLEQNELELHRAARVWESAGSYSPTFGILGAVVGLIHVMENLTEPSKLGAGIAVAFVATVYGVGLANLVYLPIYGKLCFYIDRLTAWREMYLEALVGIAEGEHPLLVEARINGFIPYA